VAGLGSGRKRRLKPVKDQVPHAGIWLAAGWVTDRSTLILSAAFYIQLPLKIFNCLLKSLIVWGDLSLFNFLEKFL
jgi:hypothetical protein